MFAEMKHWLRRLRGQIIGWAIGLFLYGLMMASFYSSIEAMEGFMDIVEQYPEALTAFVGDLTAITTPQGYMNVYYYSYMSIILGVFAVGAGAGMLVGDEEKGILDLVMAYPISRMNLFLGRMISVVIATILILLAGWLGWLLPSGYSGINLSLIEYLRPFLPLFAILMLFATLALLLSLLLPSSRTAALLTGALLVANFLVLGLANLIEGVEPLVKLTPLYYYQGGEAVVELNLAWLGSLLLLSLILASLAGWRFQVRDIRVGGEHGWRLPKLTALLGRS